MPEKIQIPTAAKRKKKDILAKIEARGHKVGLPREAEKKNVRSIARRLVEDPKYQDELLSRLRAGVAGNVEIWLWRYAYGDPQKNDEAMKQELERFERMRDQVKEFLLKAPERAHVLDAAIQRAPRLLPLPRRFPLPDESNGTDGPS